MPYYEVFQKSEMPYSSLVHGYTRKAENKIGIMTFLISYETQWLPGMPMSKASSQFIQDKQQQIVC